MKNAPLRSSPVFGRLQVLQAQVDERNAMTVAASLGATDMVRAEVAAIADLSFLHKTGLKGPKAGQWLGRYVGDVPQVNSWLLSGEGAVVARLGQSEFFIEDRRQADLCAQIQAAFRHPVDGVYPVQRNDAGFALIGEQAAQLLAEVCSFDFRQLVTGGVVMSSMAGVSVLVVRSGDGPQQCYRIWCDPTMAAYLWDTLNEIALELGGGPVGADTVLSAMPSV
ncbi:MAG: hypothetical protein PVH25_08955 [Burkholderiales bacterium]|jgi:sarcosine oxidase subunit gamma